MEQVHIHITGIVQGVGFRPFVYREAVAAGVAGWVMNAADGVHIEAAAERAVLNSFIRNLRESAPAAARIDAIEVSPAGSCDASCVPAADADFRIIASNEATAHTTLVSPDIATCPDCLHELFDPADRRYHYPFINCTNCGPRFTIIRSLPYDRPATSMDAFPMCDACAAEYANPADRRFHAQPDACFECGPHITWRERGGGMSNATGMGGYDAPVVGATREESDAIIERCAELLAAGGIVAIKGLGGFHLACNATDEHAVRELRRCKRRSRKPLAVMMQSIENVQRLCSVDDTERSLLTGSVRPIVLLRRRTSDEGSGLACPTAGGGGEAHDRGEGVHGSESGNCEFRLAPSVAFELPELGVMLPYTPLQHLLLAACAERGLHALVMTSGNLSDEPIEIDDAQAWTHLVERGLADAFLGNDRAILSRYDDSVVRVVNGIVRPVRRARGYAPQPVALPALDNGARALAARASGGIKAGSQASGGITTSLQAGNALATTGAPAVADASAGISSVPTVNGDTSPIPTILACGSEQKATLAFTREQPDGTAQCFLSQHIGDTENAETFDAWQEARRRLASLFDLHEGALACDLHPQYLASQWARSEAAEHDLPLVEVQHHHAHIASAIAEATAHGKLDPAQPVIGIALDGTGAGTDGTIWGGEILIATLDGYERAGHLKPWRLPGGAASVRDARRNAYALLSTCGLLDHPGAQTLIESLSENERSTTATMIERGLNSPLTSSMGRLLDAIAALLDICPRATYEGEPAIELEAAARRALDACDGSWERALGNMSHVTATNQTNGSASTTNQTIDRSPYNLDLTCQAAPTPDGATASRQALVGERPAPETVVADPTPLLAAVLASIARSEDADTIALGVHEAVAQMVRKVAARERDRTGIQHVVLGGGVFLNRLLLERIPELLGHDGFTVHIPRDVPVNDGGLAYGQAAVARARLQLR